VQDNQDNSITVSIADLERVFAACATWLRLSGIERIEVDRDLFWKVQRRDAFDLSKSPSALNVGSLKTDLEEVRKVVSGKMPPVPLMLIHLAHLIEEIGERQYDKQP